MEHYQPVVVIEAPFAWDDVGSWQALARSVRTDEAGNTVLGKHLGIRTTGTIVRGTPDHLIVTLGLKDTIVVHTPDATLVADKHQEEAIREVVKAPGRAAAGGSICKLGQASVPASQTVADRNVCPRRLPLMLQHHRQRD